VPSTFVVFDTVTCGSRTGACVVVVDSVVGGVVSSVVGGVVSTVVVVVDSGGVVGAQATATRPATATTAAPSARRALLVGDGDVEGMWGTPWSGPGVSGRIAVRRQRRVSRPN
jgi:hypothetical protein